MFWILPQYFIPPGLGWSESLISYMLQVLLQFSEVINEKWIMVAGMIYIFMANPESLLSHMFALSFFSLCPNIFS